MAENQLMAVQSNVHLTLMLQLCVKITFSHRNLETND